ncbi:unnamed protein product, partial [Chrysoparadoxa australica]
LEKNNGLDLEKRKSPLFKEELYLLSLGSIRSSPKYHTSKHIFPVGYRSQRVVMCPLLNKALVLTCAIETGPIFRITIEKVG